MPPASGETIWAVLVYGVLVMLLIGGMIATSWLLGGRHRAPGRNRPYESGVEPTGTAHLRYGVRYYLVAVFFLLFDVEAVIVLAWAVAFRELGWAGYASASLFIVVLALGLLYIWRLGALDYYTGGVRRPSGEVR